MAQGAVDMAHMNTENSPDTVIVSKKGVKMGQKGAGAEEGLKLWQGIQYPRLPAKKNVSDSVFAFVEKRDSNQKAEKLLWLFA